jgi:hypothetical protein
MEGIKLDSEKLLKRSMISISAMTGFVTENY